MAERVLTGLGALVALVVGFMPDLVPAETVTLVMVIGGIVYVALAVDASDAGGFLITAIAIATLSGSGAVGSIPAIGGALDAAIGHLSSGLNGGVAAVLAIGIFNKLKG